MLHVVICVMFTNQNNLYIVFNHYSSEMCKVELLKYLDQYCLITSLLLIMYIHIQKMYLLYCY